jgi:putative transposase
MIMAIKVRLRPTAEQLKKLWQSAGVSRFAYNWAIGYEENNYINGGKFIDDCELRRIFTELKKQPGFSWLYETSNNITKQAIKDACNAYKKFFKIQKTGEKFTKNVIEKAKRLNRKLTLRDMNGYPQFKKRNKVEPSFYNDPIKLKYKNGKFLLEKVGWVRISEPERITTVSFSNPHIKYDGKYWYISVGVEVEQPEIELTGEVVGIDVGVKDLAICSNEMKFKNINKKQKTKKQTKKLRRLQRKVSRKYQKNKKGGKFVKTSNIVKLEKNIKLVHRKIANIRLNHIHQATAAIVKTKPSRVVMESLNIKGMMKNRHLSKAIGEQGLYNFKSMLKYKCEFYGIDFVEADRWYPSSKKCIVCGNIKKDLKLSDRTYRCPVCGNVIDRDYQAALNLSTYQIS